MSQVRGLPVNGFPSPAVAELTHTATMRGYHYLRSFGINALPKGLTALTSAVRTWRSLPEEVTTFVCKMLFSPCQRAMVRGFDKAHNPE